MASPHSSEHDGYDGRVVDFDAARNRLRPADRRRRTGKYVVRIAATAATLLAAATVVVPIVTAGEAPGCRVQVEDGDTGAKIAARGNTTLNELYGLNPKIKDWGNLQPGPNGDHLLTEECGDLGADHTVEPLNP